MPSALTATYKDGISSCSIYMRGTHFDIQNDGKVAYRYLQGETLNQIADSYDVVRNTIKKSLLREGVVIRAKNDPVYVERRPLGENHHAWKGGRFHNGEGYVMVYAHRGHPFLSAMAVSLGGSKYFHEHRLVMAEHLDRPLASHEEVHHKNGIRDDNRIENLQLRSTRHGAGQSWRCADCGSMNVLAETI